MVEKHKANPDLLVYDYAVGGDDVRALGHQVKIRFLPHVGKQPEWAPWKSDNTLFGMYKGLPPVVNLKPGHLMAR